MYLIPRLRHWGPWCQSMLAAVFVANVCLAGADHRESHPREYRELLHQTNVGSELFLATECLVTKGVEVPLCAGPTLPNKQHSLRAFFLLLLLFSHSPGWLQTL